MALSTLMYHGILESASSSRYHLSRADFQAHLEELGRGAKVSPVVPDSEGAGLSGLALTFDDGHPGWLNAAEDLAARGWRAAFFVVTCAIGRSGELSKPDLRRLASLGHVVGSHTVDHAHLSRAEPAFVLRQWSESKAFLEDVLGSPVLSASVPGGYYRAHVGEAAAAAGLRHLFTSEPVRTPWRAGPCAVYGRFAVINGMQASRAAGLARGAPLPAAGEYALWQAKKLVKAALGPYYESLRKAQARPSSTGPAASDRFQ